MSERESVRLLGERIGYGNMMQLAEKIWNDLTPGGAHSVGPCVGLLVPCPCGHPSKCDWCEGAGRVTKRVAQAMSEAAK